MVYHVAFEGLEGESVDTRVNSVVSFYAPVVLFVITRLSSVWIEQARPKGKVGGSNPSDGMVRCRI